MESERRAKTDAKAAARRAPLLRLLTLPPYFHGLCVELFVEADQFVDGWCRRETANRLRRFGVAQFVAIAEGGFQSTYFAAVTFSGFSRGICAAAIMRRRAASRSGVSCAVAAT